MGVWIAMTTRPLKERLAVNYLNFAGMRNTLPMELKPEKKPSRYLKGKAPEPKAHVCHRGYIYVHVPTGKTITDTIERAKLCPAIRGVVGVRGKALLIREAGQVAKLEEGYVLDPLNLLGAVQLPPFAVNDVVMLNEAAGAWSGYRGIVKSLKDDELELAIEGLHVALFKAPMKHAEKLAA